MAKKRRIGSNAGRQATDPNPFTAFEYYAYADQFYDAFYKLGRTTSIHQYHGHVTSYCATRSSWR